MKPLLAAALLAFLLPACRADYSSSGDVVELSPSNFKSELKNGVWLTVFYAPW